MLQAWRYVPSGALMAHACLASLAVGLLIPCGIFVSRNAKVRLSLLLRMLIFTDFRLQPTKKEIAAAQRAGKHPPVPGFPVTIPWSKCKRLSCGDNIDRV
jgi:hypothetical protein